MNKQRRRILTTAIAHLEDAKSMIEAAFDDEQESYDNMPENLQDSEKGEACLDTLDTLDGAIIDVDSEIDAINEAVS